MRSGTLPFVLFTADPTGAALPQPYAHFVSFSKNGGFLHLDAEKTPFLHERKTSQHQSLFKQPKLRRE
nr:hypothetical protein [uncultured Agathobaculum sp.]